MSRPDLSRVPAWYHGYINLVTEDDLMKVMKEQTVSFARFLENIPAGKQDFRYAEDKWTIKELVQHILDAERIFVYRALCFARKDATNLPSFEENDYAANSKAGNRDWNEMIEEFKTLRRSTEIMFASFDKEQLDATGKSNNNPIYVLAIGFIIVGHVTHHVNVMQERYGV